MRLRGWISSYPNEAFWQGFRACQPRGGRAALEGFDGCCFLSRWHVPSTVPGPHLRHLAVFTTTPTDGYPFPTEHTETQPKSLAGRHMSSQCRARDGSQVWVTLDPSPQPPRRTAFRASGHLLRSALTVAHPVSLPAAGCSLPPPALDGEDALPDLDLLPPPPPPPPAYLPPCDDQPPASMGASLISDLEQLHLPPPPPPPQVPPRP